MLLLRSAEILRRVSSWVVERYCKEVSTKSSKTGSQRNLLGRGCTKTACVSRVRFGSSQRPELDLSLACQRSVDAGGEKGGGSTVCV